LKSTNRVAQVRTDAGLSVKDFAAKLGVDTTTAINWENGRRQLTLDRLLQIAELFGVSVSYLLGQDEQVPHDIPISISKLSVLHRLPVWTKSFGWALVDAFEKQLCFIDNSKVHFDEIAEPIYMSPPVFLTGLIGIGEPLKIDDVLVLDRLWVEPISIDFELSSELRGWYSLCDNRFVQNEYGNRFYIDTYGAKWLAFADCLEKSNQSINL
jgi:transcriptional regulator with XRE-family HTH domain